MFKMISIGLGLLLLIGFFYLKNRQFVPNHFQKLVKTGGNLEAFYLKTGQYPVLTKEYPLLQGFEKFIIHYPSHLQEATGKFPLIVVANGSGTAASKYENFFKHLASYGFIVIGTEEKYAWNGFAADMSLFFLQDIDKKATLGENNEINPFFNKINFEKVGIVGHSQGGVGVFNAISTQKNASIYQTAVALSPTKIELAKNLYWHYDASLIKTPILLLSSSADDPFVMPEDLKAIYERISAETFKIMATKNDANHGEMLYMSMGYVTAWFLWYLQGDEKAKEAFLGEKAELFSNPLYQNQQKNP